MQFRSNAYKMHHPVANVSLLFPPEAGPQCSTTSDFVNLVLQSLVNLQKLHVALTTCPPIGDGRIDINGSQGDFIFHRELASAAKFASPD